MSKFGGVPAQQSGSKFGGQLAQPAQTLSQQRYAAEDAARKKANQEAPWYEQLGTGVKAQMGRTMLGVYELANNLTGDRLMDPTVLAEAQREADRTDAGTGAWGAVGNVGGDFRNYLPLGPVKGAVAAKTLKEAAIQSAKVGAAAGAFSGLTEATGNEDSSVLTNLGNAAKGGALGAGIGTVIPVGAAGVKKAGNIAGGAANRALAFAGSDKAAEKVAYSNIANLLKGQGYAPSEVASIIDEFQAQGINGGTLGQILQSSDLLAREKNLLQGGGKAGKIMSDALSDQPKNIAASVIAKAKEYANPEQTGYLYKQAADLADSPTARQMADGVVSMGQSASAKELPFTLNAIEEDLVARGDELPPAVLKRIQRIVATAKADGGFEAADTAKKQLDDLFKENSNTTDQDIVNEVVKGYRRMINDSLEQAGGEVYAAAKNSAKRDMAMNDMASAVQGAQGASVKTALNKFFGSFDQQEEFLGKLPPELQQQFRTYLDNLQKVSGRFGGSDTASNTATQKAMAAETGIGFDPNLNPLTILDRATAPLQRRVREATARATLAPNADTIAGAMRKGASAPKVAAKTVKLLSNEASKAATQTEQAPAMPITPIPSPQPAPQSSADPMLDKFAMAESSGNPNAKNPNSSASGKFQFTDDTWARSVQKWGKETGIGLKDKNDERAQAVMAKKLALDNARILSNSLRRQPTVGELYMAHVFGASDATKLIRSDRPTRQAATLFSSKVVDANRPLFFDGKRPRTVAELQQLLNDKVT